MSHVKTIYRAAAGVYRRKTVERSGKWPNFLLNSANKQVHLINGKAVYPQTSLIRLDSWAQMVVQVRPDPPRFIESRRAFCEDNSFWPIDIRPHSSNQQKAEDCYLFYQETLQASKASSASEVGANQRDKMIFYVAGGIAAVGAVVILFDLAITKAFQYGGDAIPAVSVLGGG